MAKLFLGSDLNLLEYNQKFGKNLVSVIVPTYNGERFLEQTLDSVLAQSVIAEIIVSDDGSSDATLRTVQDWKVSRNVNVEILESDKNSGSPVLPINCAIQKAQADLILVLDQDDVLDPQKFAIELNLLKNNPDAAIVFSLCRRSDRVSQYGSFSQSQFVKGWSKGKTSSQISCLPSEQFLRLLIEYGQITVGYPGFLFRKSDWISVHGVSTKYRVASDFDFLVKLSSRGRIVFVPQMLYTRTVHSGNLSTVGLRGYIEILDILVTAFRFKPEWRFERSLRKAAFKRICEAAWYAAAYGSMFSAAGIILNCASKLGLYWPAAKALCLLPLMPIYRRMFLPDWKLPRYELNELTEKADRLVDYLQTGESQ